MSSASEKIFDLITRDMEFINSYSRSYKNSLKQVLQGRASEYLFSDANITYQLLRDLVRAAKESGEFTEKASIDDICIMIQTITWGLVELDNSSTNFDMVSYARRITLFTAELFQLFPYYLGYTLTEENWIWTRENA